MNKKYIGKVSVKIIENSFLKKNWNTFWLEKSILLNYQYL